MRHTLPPEGQAEAQKLFEHYRALEVAEQLTADDAMTWWSTSMSIIAKYRLDMNTIERDFLAHSSIRPGTRELFDLCAKHAIPTIIMSAGIKDIITLWCKAYDIHPTVILSTELTVDRDNRVTGWNEASVVHTFNKHEIDHPELSKIRVQRSHTILAGDSLQDHTMAAGSDTVFRVRIVDGDARSRLLQDDTFKVFDATIEDGTLYPLTELIASIV